MNATQCHHCGALLQSTNPTTCSYCGAPQKGPDLPPGCIWLTDEHVTALLRKRLTGLDATWVHPSIPAKKLANTRKVHTAHLPANEQVLALYDGTAFGSATDGFILTTKRIYWKNQLESAQFLDWEHVEFDGVYVEETQIVLGRARLDTLYGDDDDALWVWEDVIQTLARSAQPKRVRETEAPARDPRAAAAWGGDDVAVGPRSAGAWGGLAAQPAVSPALPQGTGFVQHASMPEVERLSRAPYESDESCSVVDVHPGGELVVACGGATVELRHSSNGMRYGAFPMPDTVLSARFSPDGQWLLLGGLDGRAYIVEVRSGRHQGATQPMGDGCDEVAWLGRSTYFAAGSQCGEVWIVDATTMRETRILAPDPDYHQLGGLVASADGARVFVSVGSRIGAFEAASGRVLWRNDTALSNASRLTIAPRGDVLVAAGYDGVAFFDANTGLPGARFPFPSARNVSWPEGGAGGLLSKIRKQDDEPLWSWSSRPRFSPQGHYVAVQDHVGNLSFIDAISGALHPTPREAGRAWIEDLAWFPDGNHVLLGSSDNALALWRVQPMAGLWRVKAIDELPPEAYDQLARWPS